MAFIQTTTPPLDTTTLAPRTLLGFALAFFSGLLIAGFGGLVVGALIGIVFAVLLFPRPLLAISLIVCLIAFDSVFPSVGSQIYSLTGTKLIGYILAASLGVKLLTGKGHIKLDATVVAITLFLIGIAISFLFVENLQLAIKETLRFLQLIILFFAVREFVNKEKHLILLGKVAVISLSISALAGIAQYFFTNTERIYGTSQNAAILASDLMVGLAFGFVLIRLCKTPKEKLFYATLTGIIATSILLTMTRAALLAFFPALFCVGLASGRILRVLGLFLIICILVLFTAPKMIERLTSTYKAKDNSTQLHIKTLYAGLAMTWDHPITGVGIGNFPVHYLRYSHDVRKVERTAHNSYLSIASEMGLGTLISYLLLLLIALISTFQATIWARKYNQKNMVLICYAVIFILVSFYVISFFHTLRVSKLFWIFLAIGSELPAIIWRVSKKTTDSLVGSQMDT